MGDSLSDTFHPSLITIINYTGVFEMKEFSAKTLDLELQLTGLDGEEKIFKPSPDFKYDANSLNNVLTTMMKMENEYNDKKVKERKISAAELLCSELELVYDNIKEYLLSNFDIGTIREILFYVSATIGGYQKN